MIKIKLVTFGLVAILGVLIIPETSKAIGVGPSAVTVTGITLTKTLLTRSDIGGRMPALEVYVNYSEAMDQTIKPVISYESPSLVNSYPSGLQAGDCGGSWISETQYLFPCALGGTDYPGEKVDDIDIRVTGAQNLTGSVQEDFLEIDAFSIDTIVPVIAEVISVTTPTDNDHHGRRWVLYRHYKSIYTSDKDKDDYAKVKNLKNTNRAEFERLKAMYAKYKSLKNKEREGLSLSIQRDYSLYKNYRGYKLYKRYKNQIGR